MITLTIIAFIVGFISWMIYESDNCPCVNEETGEIINYTKDVDI